MSTGTKQSEAVSKPSRRWQFGWCEYVEVSRELLVHGEIVKPEGKPLDVLQVLLERAPAIVTRSELLDAAWQTSTEDGSLTQAIRKLRDAFGGDREAIILTVVGIGYRMAVPVTCSISANVPVPALDLKAGDQIPGRPDWVAIRPLGFVQPNTVWLAESKKTHEAHVFKFALDGVRLRALQREVVISRLLRESLTPQSFVRLTDWDLVNQPYFIQSEYFGLNLFEWSQTDAFAATSQKDRVVIACQIAEAVAAAHDLGILHNDLKPSNILVLEKTLGLEIKIADFGIASLADPDRLRDFEITNHEVLSGESTGGTRGLGSQMYRAPELYSGGARGALTDVYSLGVILYQILCGDFLVPPTFGSESRIADPLLRQDIADAANDDPRLRIKNASELAQRLGAIEQRREQQQAREKELAEKRAAEEALAHERLRKPWLIATCAAFCLALVVSLWFDHEADRALDIAQLQSNTLSAMYGFLADDLLAQSNPLNSPARGGSGEQETLLDAISRILPQIDRRFSKAPEVAGRLHETIGIALDVRTRFAEAQQQFAIAAQRFREAEGPLSQKAIVAELRRENVGMQLQTESSIRDAKIGFAAQEKLIARIKNITPELQAWHAFVKTGDLIFGTQPEQGLQLLKDAVSRAEATPGFSQSLLLNMKARFCGIYLRLNRGADAEQAARAVIAATIALKGPDSPALFQPEMFLEEALYLQGKNKEVIQQSTSDYARFGQVLGPQNQLTLSALTMRAESETLMENYAAAITDYLAIYNAEKSNPSGGFLKENSLSEAATCECHSGRFASGIEHARTVVRESSGSGTNDALPVFVNTANFNIAECLISQQEEPARTPSPKALKEASALLDKVDVGLVSQAAGQADFEGGVDVARARLSLLLKNAPAAKHWADKAAKFIDKEGADPYDRNALDRVRKSLATPNPTSK